MSGTAQNKGGNASCPKGKSKADTKKARRDTAKLKRLLETFFAGFQMGFRNVNVMLYEGETLA